MLGGVLDGDPRIVDALVAHATRSAAEDAGKGEAAATAASSGDKGAGSVAPAKTEGDAVATAEGQPPPQSGDQKD